MATPDPHLPDCRLLEYTPSARITPLQACAHNFFDELREASTRLPNGNDLPPLFNFTESELKIQPSLNAQLIPSHVAQSGGGAAGSGGEDVGAGSGGSEAGQAGTGKGESMNEGSPSAAAAASSS